MPLPNTPLETAEQAFALGVSRADELVRCQEHEIICKTLLSLPAGLGKGTFEGMKESLRLYRTPIREK